MARLIKPCIDRVLPRDTLISVAGLAVAERPGNAPTGVPPPTTPEDHFRMAVETKKLWPNARTLRIRFLEGETYVQDKMLDVAREWCDHANVAFEKVTSGTSDIRIAMKNDGHWSEVGTDTRGVGPDDPTMNLEGFSRYTRDDEYRRVVLHEFGHALGCIHEHQSPSIDRKIPWNREAVYRFYAGSPNFWNEAEIKANIFARYDQRNTQFTDFDPNSIMVYPIPPELLTDRRMSVDWNSGLSHTDKKFISERYPRLDRSIPQIRVGDKITRSFSREGEEHRYRFVADQVGVFIVETGGQVDVVLTLYGPDASTLKVARNRHGGYGVDAKVRERLHPGEYLIHIQHAENRIGPYDLVVRIPEA